MPPPRRGARGASSPGRGGRPCAARTRPPRAGLGPEAHRRAKGHAPGALEERGRGGAPPAPPVQALCWGAEEEEESRIESMNPFAVTTELLSQAKSEALFMHCMPTHPGMEVSQEVLDSPKTIIFDQAENRLHMQKAILAKLASKSATFSSSSSNQLNLGKTPTVKICRCGSRTGGSATSGRTRRGRPFPSSS